jgi:hypothetical protein
MNNVDCTIPEHASVKQTGISSDGCAGIIINDRNGSELWIRSSSEHILDRIAEACIRQAAELRSKHNG